MILCGFATACSQIGIEVPEIILDGDRLFYAGSVQSVQTYTTIAHTINLPSEQTGTIRIISIRPNPGHGIAEITIWNEGGYSNAELSIVDMQGRLMANQHL